MANIHPRFFSDYYFWLGAYNAQGRLVGSRDNVPVTRPGTAIRLLALARRRGAYRTVLDVVDRSPY